MMTKVVQINNYRYVAVVISGEIETDFLRFAKPVLGNAVLEREWGVETY